MTSTVADVCCTVVVVVVTGTVVEVEDVVVEVEDVVVVGTATVVGTGVVGTVSRTAVEGTVVDC